MRFDDLDNTSYELVADMLDLPALLTLCVCQRALQRRLLALAPVWRRKRGALLTAIVATKSPAELRIIEQVYADATIWTSLSIAESILMIGACVAGELWKVQWVDRRFSLLWKGRTPAGAFRTACEKGHLDVARWLFARYHHTKKAYKLNMLCEIARRSPRPIVVWMIEVVIPRSNATRFFSAVCTRGRSDLAGMIANHYALSAASFTDLADLFCRCDASDVARVAWALNLTPAIARDIAPRVRTYGDAKVAMWLTRFGA